MKALGESSEWKLTEKIALAFGGWTITFAVFITLTTFLQIVQKFPVSSIFRKRRWLAKNNRIRQSKTSECFFEVFRTLPKMVIGCSLPKVALYHVNWRKKPFVYFPSNMAECKLHFSQEKKEQRMNKTKAHLHIGRKFMQLPNVIRWYSNYYRLLIEQISAPRDTVAFSDYMASISSRIVLSIQ